MSYDGFSVFVSRKQQSKFWLHIDQHPQDKLYSVQGAYNFLPVGEADAGLLVVPKSHKTYTDAPAKAKQFIQRRTRFSSNQVDNSRELFCFVEFKDHSCKHGYGQTQEFGDQQAHVLHLLLPQISAVGGGLTTEVGRLQERGQLWSLCH